MYCPVRGDIRLPSDRLVSLRETVLLPAPRWIATWFHPRLPLPDCCVLVSTLSIRRHSYRSGRTTRGNAASYSAWHTHIAGVGVLALYLLPGCFPFPACPRAYLYTSSIKAGSLPSGALSCAPSPVLRTPRTPFRLRTISAFRLYTHGLCPTRLPARVSPVPLPSFETCHRPLPRRGPATVPVQVAVCCLRRDMSGSALPNTFRLII